MLLVSDFAHAFGVIKKNTCTYQRKLIHLEWMK